MASSATPQSALTQAEFPLDLGYAGHPVSGNGTIDEENQKHRDPGPSEDFAVRVSSEPVHWLGTPLAHRCVSGIDRR